MWQKLSPSITNIFWGNYIGGEYKWKEEVTYRAGSLTSFLGQPATFFGGLPLACLCEPAPCLHRKSAGISSWLDNNFLSQLLTSDHFVSTSFANPALPVTYHRHSPFQSVFPFCFLLPELLLSDHMISPGALLFPTNPSFVLVLCLFVSRWHLVVELVISCGAARRPPGGAT